MKTEAVSQQKERFFDRRTCFMTLQLIAGTLIYSLGVVWFLNLGEFFAGGVTGTSQLISFFIFGKVSPLLSLFIPLLNLPLFIIGWRNLSKKFTILTIISVSLQMVFIYLFEWLSQQHGINPVFEVISKYDAIIMVDGKYMAANTDAGVRLLLAFLGGFICGLGNALCLTSGGSSGGIDVIANTLLIKRSISLTKFSFIYDGIIILLSIFVGGVNTALFTIVRFLSSLMTVDRFYRIYQFIRIEIVTERLDEVRELLLTKFHHGVTIYSAIGGYTMKEKKMLEVFASRYEMNDYIHEIQKIDPAAFITITDITALKGKYNKKTII